MTEPLHRVQTGILSPAWTEVLFQVAQEFTSSLDLDSTLGKILSLTLEAVDAETGSIFLLDSQHRPHRRILARKYLPPEMQDWVAAEVMAHGLAGWAVRRGEVGLVSDTRKDERWHTFPDDPPTTRAAIAMPLQGHDGIVGVLTLQHSQPGHFTRRMAEFLQTIARQAAIAVENAALYTRAANERSTLQAVISGVQDAILVLDTQDRLLLANPAAAQILAPIPAVPGCDLSTALPDGPLRELICGWSEGLSRTEATLPDGRVMEAALTGIPGVGKMIGLHDITTFRKLDQLKSEFVASVAHDLKSPLGVISGYAWVLADTPGLPPDAHGYVERILGAVTRMRTLIDDILDLRKIEMQVDAERFPADLGMLSRDAVRGNADLAAEKGVSLTAVAPEDLPPVLGVAPRLGQAINNLIGNALKFTPTGGQVTVTAAREGAEVVVRVRDTGPGIPAAKMPKLFQKFSRLGEPATRKQEGHGLGLAIVRSVVETHGGRVWAESTPGKGSVFAFALPASAPQ